MEIVCFVSEAPLSSSGIALTSLSIAISVSLPPPPRLSVFLSVCHLLYLQSEQNASLSQAFLPFFFFFVFASLLALVEKARILFVSRLPAPLFLCQF